MAHDEEITIRSQKIPHDGDLLSLDTLSESCEPSKDLQNVIKLVKRK